MLKRVTAAQRLKIAFDQSNVVLVLGAGISRTLGIPDWPTLLRNIIASMHPATIKDALIENQTNPLILARYIRESFKDRDEFNDKVHKALYRDYNNNYSNNFFRAAAKFIEISLNKGGIKHVITYNFDTILEDWLKQRTVGLDYYSSDWKSVISGQRNGVQVFHCHGFLPMDPREAKGQHIVFDEAEYHQIYYDHYNFSNIIQLLSFTNNSCLFCGISLSDPNMRRLLDYAKKSMEKEAMHFMFRKKPLKPRTIRTELMKLFDKDAYSLGVQIMWIDDYEEIAIKINELIN